MKKIMLIVGSVTYAIKLRKLLKREGISSNLVKTDTKDNNPGCSHGVEISENDFYHAVITMKENGINYSLYQNKYDLP